MRFKSPEDQLEAIRSRSWYLNWLNAAIRLAKFLLLLLVAYIIYATLLGTIFTRHVHIFTYIAFWLFTAYLVLPRINRRIARIYIPDYFIGRTRTSDGLLGDPINLAFDGREKDIIACLEQAGWARAEDLGVQSSLKMAATSVLGRSYPHAPVSSLFLFGNKQDLAFQREIDNNPRRRHHVRFWKTPEGWYLPGGHRSGWLGAATYDKHIGLSLFTGQITHKIDANVDKERDFLLKTLKKNPLLREVKLVEHFTSSYHSRNGGGDMIHTDGSLPFVKIGHKQAAGD